MSDAHELFQEWLLAGAEGDPARWVAVHASACPSCRQSLEALDALAEIDPGLAGMPALPALGDDGRVYGGRLAVTAAGVVFSAVVVGVGASQLISWSRGGGLAAVGSPTPNQGVLGGTGTPQPTVTASPTSQETLTPLDTPTAPPSATALATVKPKPIPTVAPTTVPTAVPTPVPTPVPTEDVTPTPVPTPTPTAPGSPQSLAATPGAGSITIDWALPASDGGSAITTYHVFRRTDTDAIAEIGTVPATSPQTYTDSDSALVAGTTYYYTVTAENGVGAGPPSNEVSASPT